MASKSSAFVLATFLLLLMVSHFAFAARTMQMSSSCPKVKVPTQQTNLVHSSRTHPNPTETGLTDNKNFVFGGVGSGVGFVGPFGGVGGFSGVGGGGVGGVSFPVGGSVGGLGGVGGGGGGGLPLP